MQINLSETIECQIVTLCSQFKITPEDFVSKLVIDYVKGNQGEIISSYPSSRDYEAYSVAYKTAMEIKPSKAMIAQRLAFLAEHRNLDNPNVRYELVLVHADDITEITQCIKWLLRKYKTLLNGLDTLISFLPHEIELVNAIELDDLAVIQYLKSQYPSLKANPGIPNILTLVKLNVNEKHQYLARAVARLLSSDDAQQSVIFTNLLNAFTQFEEDTLVKTNARPNKY